jgi:hypothetical protein
MIFFGYCARCLPFSYYFSPCFTVGWTRWFRWLRCSHFTVLTTTSMPPLPPFTFAAGRRRAGETRHWTLLDGGSSCGCARAAPRAYLLLFGAANRVTWDRLCDGMVPYCPVLRNLAGRGARFFVAVGETDAGLSVVVRGGRGGQQDCGVVRNGGGWYRTSPVVTLPSRLPARQLLYAVCLLPAVWFSAARTVQLPVHAASFCMVPAARFFLFPMPPSPARTTHLPNMACTAVYGRVLPLPRMAFIIVPAVKKDILTPLLPMPSLAATEQRAGLSPPVRLSCLAITLAWRSPGCTPLRTVCLRCQEGGRTVVVAFGPAILYSHQFFFALRG